MDVEGRHVQKSRPRSSTKHGPFLRASLRTKGKRMQRFCQVPRECPVKFPRREGHLFLPVEDGPARVGRSTLRAVEQITKSGAIFARLRYAAIILAVCRPRLLRGLSWSFRPGSFQLDLAWRSR